MEGAEHMFSHGYVVQVITEDGNIYAEYENKFGRLRNNN